MPSSSPASPAVLPRCHWYGDHADYQDYHDTEWGFPVGDDRALFEKLCLEGFQSGLSWLTILRKRENFRRAFANFEIERLARWNERNVKRLLGDAGIVRHRGKIEAALNNARCARRLQTEAGSLAAFFWSFEPRKTDPPTGDDERNLSTITRSSASKALAKALKKRGFRFVGPTTAYAFMQSMGIVNDHAEHCATRARVERARDLFERPSLATGFAR